MLKLDLKRKPYWLDLGSGVRLHVKPLTTAIVSAAQNIVIRQIGQLREVNDLPEDKDKVAGISESLFIKVIAQMAILEWEGVLIGDETTIAVVNNQNISDLMDVWFVAQDFSKKYIQSLMLLETEGKLSGLSPNGTSVEGPNTVSAAKIKTCRVVKAKKITPLAKLVRM